MDIQYDDEWDGEEIKKKEYEKYKDNYYLPEHLENYGKYLYDDDYYKYHNMTPNQRSSIHSHNSWVILFVCLIPFLVIVNGGAFAILLIIIGSIYAIKEEHNLQLYFKERDYRIANNLTVQELDEYNDLKRFYGKEIADVWKKYKLAYKVSDRKWMDYYDEFHKLKRDLDFSVVDTVRKDTDIYIDTDDMNEDKCDDVDDENMEVIIIPPEDIEVI